MKPIENIERYLQQAYENWVRNLMKAQHEACEIILEEIRDGAPVDTGAYRDSIRVSETVRIGDVIRTVFYSDYTLADANTSNTPTLEQWANVALATLIENGTAPHIITPRDPDGVLRWQDDEGNVHFAKLVHHTGTAPNPHWTRAIMENQGLLRRMLRRARWRI